MKPVRTIILAKAPRPGRVKTRLIPLLGADGAAALAREMLARTVAAARDARIGPVELCASPAIDDAAWADVALPDDIAFSAQRDGDLGARMAHAAERTVARGEAVLLVGTDCAEIGAALLREAARRLADTDAVLHPTADGGYAVLGLRRFDRRVFDGIAWSTATVAATTIARLNTLGWSSCIGCELHDVDEPDDLIWLERCLRSGAVANFRIRRGAGM